MTFEHNCKVSWSMRGSCTSASMYFMLFECEITLTHSLTHSLLSHPTPITLSDITAQFLINNAGISEQVGKLEDDQDRLYERVLDINFTAVVEGSRLAIGYMKQSQQRNGPHEGVILNVSSMSALVPLGVAPVYSASKAGVSRSRAGAGVAGGGGIPEWRYQRHPYFEQTTRYWRLRSRWHLACASSTGFACTPYAPTLWVRV